MFRLLFLGSIVSAFVAANPLGIPGLPNISGLHSQGAKRVSAPISLRNITSVSSWGRTRIRMQNSGSGGSMVDALNNASRQELNRRAGKAGSGAKFVKR